MKNHKTDQENFWADAFGNEYIDRNKSSKLLASNIYLFTKALHLAEHPTSLIEFGANIGMNLRALKLLYPDIELNSVEINTQAAEILKDFVGPDSVFNGSIFDYEVNRTFDIALIKGVLIHINPEMLPAVYEKLYNSSSKYILVCEYYNPTPVAIPYRGHNDRLFKRDFAGEMLDMYEDLSLVDYGFVYHRDNSFPKDDLTWFLLSK